MISWMLIFFVPSVILFFVCYFALAAFWNALQVSFHKIRHAVVSKNLDRLALEIRELNLADFREGSSAAEVKWRWKALKAFDWRGAYQDYTKWHWTLNDVLGARAGQIEGVRV